MSKKANMDNIFITLGGDNMRSYPSRAEKREVRLYSEAEKGVFSLEFTLYPSEITKLEKQGFNISSPKPYSNSKDLFTVTVDWSKAFGVAIPHIVHSYINKIIETFPKDSINNLAQELYVIAQRACKK